MKEHTFWNNRERDISPFVSSHTCNVSEPGEMESFEIVDGSNTSRRQPLKIDERASRIRHAKFETAEKLQREFFGEELSIKIMKKPRETLLEKIKRSEQKKLLENQRRESLLSRRTPKSESADSRTNSVRSKLVVSSNQEDVEEEAGQARGTSFERELEDEMEEIGSENEILFTEIEVMETKSEPEFQREEEESIFVEKTAEGTISILIVVVNFWILSIHIKGNKLRKMYR